MDNADPAELFVHLASRLTVMLGSIDALGLAIGNYDRTSLELRKRILKAAGGRLKD